MTKEDGSFDRKRLGNIVFQDAQAMDALNAITHRYVDRAIRAWLEEAKADVCPAGAVDAIRLLESGLDRLCDVTLAITAPPEIRVSRIMAREGISQNYAWARVKAQQPDEFYTAHCSYQLVNDCQTAQEFEARAAWLWQKILAKR
jgi:dephospho-CoA kinase